MTGVYALRLSDINDKEELLWRAVGSERREKARRFRQRDDRLRCLAAGYLTEKYLPGFSAERLRIGKDGKPFLDGGAAFSISHGGNFVTLAWDDTAESIGIDVEPIASMEFFRDILTGYTTREERDAIGGSAKAAVWVWTRKECLYKCIGEGIDDPLELPEVLNDRVQFRQRIFSLESREKEGHIFSVARIVFS